MKLSIIIPVYNTKKYIRKCLDSILNQNFEGLEIILVNDGSTDDTPEILREYEKKYPDKIIVIDKENGGQGSARNVGMKIAKGDYITFVDSDDYIKENMYQEMYDMATEGNYDIVVCGVEDVYEKNGACNVRSLFDKKDISVADAIVNSIPSVCNKIYRKTLFKQKKMLFDEHIGYEDFPYSMQLLMNAKRIGYIDKPFYEYVQRIKSSMHNENIIKNLDIIKGYEQIVEYAKKNNIYKKYDEEIHYLLLKEVYITTINRILRTNNPLSEKKKVIKQIKEYSKEAGLRKTKYFKSLPKSFRITYYMIQMNLYSIITLLFKIKEK